MNRNMPDVNQALFLADRIDPQYRPVWAHRPPQQQAALARYFLPHHSGKPLLDPDTSSGDQVVLPVRLPVELPKWPSVLHQCVHRLRAQVRVLLRDRLLA